VQTVVLEQVEQLSGHAEHVSTAALGSVSRKPSSQTHAVPLEVLLLGQLQLITPYASVDYEKVSLQTHELGEPKDNSASDSLHVRHPLAKVELHVSQLP